ncbi:DinB family protein [Streptomyces sp. NPDC007164]|uniref:DinB family protein n=1 Tax=Streptomyces sp. NPDC007164 TaxID=3156918 RepID=UPI0033EB7A41
MRWPGKPPVGCTTRARDCRKGVLPAVNTTARPRSPLGRTPLLLPDCDRCGFTSSRVRHDTVVGLLRKYAAEWQWVLTRPGLDGRRVGVPHWSPLEHGCHVRDMCLLFHKRLDAIFGTTPIAPDHRTTPDVGPVTESPDSVRRYRDEAPRQVAEELGWAAEALARRLATLADDDDWDRDGTCLADSRLTVDFFTRHLLHDIAHDLAEVRRGDRSDRARPETAASHNSE